MVTHVVSNQGTNPAEIPQNLNTAQGQVPNQQQVRITLRGSTAAATGAQQLPAHSKPVANEFSVGLQQLALLV